MHHFGGGDVVFVQIATEQAIDGHPTVGANQILGRVAIRGLINFIDENLPVFTLRRFEFLEDDIAVFELSDGSPGFSDHLDTGHARPGKHLRADAYRLIFLDGDGFDLPISITLCEDLVGHQTVSEQLRASPTMISEFALFYLELVGVGR